MSAMVLCPGCKRHVFAGEQACPFCGIGFVSAQAAPAPSIGPELSRAQRYVVGAAMAASIATAGCSSPTVVRNPDDARDVTVDVNETQREKEQRQSLEVARDPNGDDQALADQEAARREQEERARREAEQRQKKQHDLIGDDGNDWRQHRQHHECVNGVCPPYGCVFPDEACDIVRV